jgi:hypothetical protein
MLPVYRVMKSLSRRIDRYPHAAHMLHKTVDHIAGLDRTDSLGRASHYDITRIKCVDGRRILNETGNINDQGARIGRLADLTVYAQAQV